MTRAFSTTEKERIHQGIKETSRELFTRYGLKKASVADITKQVGIAQGTFYQFYSSKEALYFSILEDEEARIQQVLLSCLPISRPLQARDLEAMMIAGYEEAKATPLMMQLISGEAYQDMISRLPAEAIAEHTRHDEDRLLPLVEKWQQEGVMIREKPQIIAGVLRALFLLILHEKELGQEHSSEIFRLMVRLVARGLCVEENRKAVAVASSETHERRG